MKKKLFLFLILLSVFSAAIILNSCQKEISCYTCQTSPIAKAGIDQIVILPTDTVTLDGRASSDPDGTIIAFVWTKISGPVSSTIVNPVLAITKIRNLIQGVYIFELKVTDNEGLSSTDTVQITVHMALNAQLVPFGKLSQARLGVSTATAGTKILFAGGASNPFSFSVDSFSTRVDIYDFAANTWSIAELSIARRNMVAATVGNKIFFAGGGYDVGTGWNQFSRVDIYDAVANTWSTAELSQARGELAAAAVGDKVLFAGGYHYSDNKDVYSTRVDIYNNTTNTWSIAELSEGREGLSATTAGNKIYFAGGSKKTGTNPSNKIDIYDGASHSWSISTLNEGKTYFGSIAVGPKIFWAGGWSGQTLISSQVEIRDINTQVSTITGLSQAKAAFETVLKGNEIVFFITPFSEHPGDFDIYNTVSQKWSVGRLNVDLTNTGIISVNNKIYVAGGISSNLVTTDKVWLLEW